MASEDKNSFTGKFGNTNCWVRAPGQAANSGCGIRNNDPNSMGEGFNAKKGGVLALVWDPETGLKVWNWERPNVPADIRSTSGRIAMPRTSASTRSYST